MSSRVLELPLLRVLRSGSFRTLAAAVLLLAALAAYLLNATAALSNYSADADFHRLIATTARFWAGLPTYTLTPSAGSDQFLTGVSREPYPPSFFLAFRPWALMSEPVANLTWLGLQLVALVAILAFVYQGLGRPTRAELLTAVAVSLVFLPVRETVFEGQFGLVLGGLCAGAMLANRRGYGGVAAPALALAIALKLTPALLLGYFLLRRAYWAVLLSLAWLAGLIGATLALGWSDRWLNYATFMVPIARGTAFVGNHSIQGAVLRLFRPDMRGQPIAPPPWPLTVTSIILQVALIAMVAWRLRRQPAGELAAWTEFSLVLLAIPLVQPFAWFHHWAIALPAIPVACRLVRLGLVRVLPAALLFASLVLSFLAYPLYRLVRDIPGAELAHQPGLLVISYVFLAAVVAAVLAFTLLTGKLQVASSR